MRRDLRGGEVGGEAGGEEGAGLSTDFGQTAGTCTAVQRDGASTASLQGVTDMSATTGRGQEPPAATSMSPPAASADVSGGRERTPRRDRRRDGRGSSDLGVILADEGGAKRDKRLRMRETGGGVVESTRRDGAAR